MRKLSVFNQVTLDGYFSGEGGNLDWAYAQRDAEWDRFTAENAQGGGALLFGRVTHDMMRGFWPTDAARQQAPLLAERMNTATKFVVSRSLDRSDWANTTVLSGEIGGEVRKLKQAPGPDITVLGSGSIVSQLTALGLVDQYQVVVVPVVLGRGRTMFEGVPDEVKLRLCESRTFGNGNVVLWYEPAG